jgi:hypothetical protein
MTAVEWLFENLNIYVLSEDMKAEIKIFEQAKEMELEKLQQAYESGFNDARRSSNEFGSIFKEY